MSNLVMIKQKVIHPFLFAIFPVLALFSYNIDEVYPVDIFIPSLIVLIFTFLVWIGLGFVLKSKRKSGLIVSIGLVLFFAFGHIHNLLGGIFISDIDIGKYRHLLPIFLVFFVIPTYYIIRTNKNLAKITTVGNAISVTLIIISIFNIGMYYAEENFVLYDDPTKIDGKSSQLEADMLPDIYYLILDGYGGSDSLMEFYDYDNQEFTSFLTDRGFYVVSQGQSNYPSTYISLASSLNMKYVHYVAEKLGEDSMDKWEIKEMIPNNVVMQHLKSNGYTIINFNSGLAGTSNMKHADQNLCGRNILIDSEFLLMLAGTSMLKIAYTELLDNRKNLTLCALSTIPEMQHKINGPIFVFAHILIPHPPYLFGPNGEPVTPNTILLGGTESWKDKEGYVNQIKFLNKKIPEIIDRLLIESDNSPVIIIQGDHGPESSFTSWDRADLTEEWIRERMSILNAYYLPGNGTTLLYPSVTPVNSFRIIFNSYFNNNFELLEDQMYWNDDKAPNKFLNVTDVIYNHDG